MRYFHHDLNSQEPLLLDGESLKLEDVVSVARYNRKVELVQRAKERIIRCRAMVEVLLEQGEKIYGLTTGFGKLRDIVIELADAKKLQKNLIQSHACGVGKPFAEDVVRGAMLLRINTLCRGNSGIRLEVVEQLVKMLNDNIYPYIPQKGSVGASGDLAPLSHLALVLMGDQYGMYFPKKNRKDHQSTQVTYTADSFVQMPDSSSFKKIAAKEGWSFEPVELEAKEGLALNNGTQFMTAVGCLAVYDGFYILRYAELSGSMSTEAIRGIRDAYDVKLHLVRPHSYQAETAQRVINYCDQSQIIDLYFNTAHLYRARIHFDEAGEFLAMLEKRPDFESNDSYDYKLVKQVSDLTSKIKETLSDLLPKNPDGTIDAKKISEWSTMPPRWQIRLFHDQLLPVRQSAIDLLQIVEKIGFPKTSETRKVKTSLVGAVDQLNKVVPDSPIIQDDYSFRCYPQVLACGYRALWHVCEIMEVEINSATDNPLLFPPEPKGGYNSIKPEDFSDWLRESPDRIQQSRENVVGGGNFHGEPIAIAMDYFSIAMAEIGNISERRVASLVDDNHSRGLPSFIIESSGLNSGFMIPQYTAAALVSENKVLCHPASVDSIPTCAGTEDHNSMGTISARKAAEIIENVRHVVAIEILAAYQGLMFREPLQPGLPIRKVIEVLKENGILRYEDDRVLFPDMEKVNKLMSNPELLKCLIQ